MKCYLVSNAAGLIRSNKFNALDDALVIGSMRAQSIGMPIRIFEYENAEQRCIKVCNPDGSIESPPGDGHAPVDLGNSSSGFRNNDQAHMLMGSYADGPMVTFYLKDPITESQVQDIETSSQREVGFIDDKSFNLYTQDPKIVRSVEAWLAQANIEIDEVSLDDAVAKASVVVAARKAHKMARAERLPELSVRGSNKFGDSFKFKAHCELAKAEGKKSPRVIVYIDGQKAGEVKDARAAGSLIAEEARSAFSKYLNKELG